MITAFRGSINRRLLFVLAVLSLVAFASCKKSKTAATPPFHRSKIDPCSLITNDEVQKIQGSPIKDVKSSENSHGSFRVTRCFYTTETLSKSVNLAVTQVNPASPTAGNPRDLWKQTFGRFEGRGEEGEEEREAEREKSDKAKKRSLEEHEEREGSQPPKKMEGVGDSAFWAPNRMGGAIYVLKDDVFIRISVGGSEAEGAINRCKALAEKALSRL